MGKRIWIRIGKRGGIDKGMGMTMGWDGLGIEMRMGKGIEMSIGTWGLFQGATYDVCWGYCLSRLEICLGWGKSHGRRDGHEDGGGDCDRDRDGDGTTPIPTERPWIAASGATVPSARDDPAGGPV